MAGKTVRLFLVDGSAEGLVTAEIINWSGHALVWPRQSIGEALKRDEAGRTGVYFLVGQDPDQPTKDRVYIGEADKVSERIRTHHKDDTKDFWTRTCFITSKDPNITKSHIRYLESKLVALALESGRANVANGNEPSNKALPESDIADMDFFLDQIKLILPVIGFDFLRPKPKLSTDTFHVSPEGGQIELAISSNKHRLQARAVMSGNQVIVIAGSGALAQEFSSNSYASLREQLIRDGRLKATTDGSLLTFAEDVTFASPSAAASVIYNHNASGPLSWRIAGSDTTLKDWQDAQIS